MPDHVNHPQHYGGEDDPYEVIKVMIAWDPEMAYHFCVGNAIKYLGRLGKKDPEKRVEDLRKSSWYSEQAANIYTMYLSEEPKSDMEELLTGTINRYARIKQEESDVRR
jgi:hypothetical protein